MSSAGQLQPHVRERTPRPEDLKDIERIVVVRALQLGDLLVAVPAFRSLRQRFPSAEITLIGLPWAVAFAERFSRYIDRFVAFPGWPGIAEAPHVPERTRAFLDAQQACGYDLVIQMHGSGGASNPFALALGGRITVGYALGEPPIGLIYAAPYPDDLHEVMRNLGLVRLLGGDTGDTGLEFPLTHEDEEEAEALLRALRIASGAVGIIGIHPGARAPSRRWSPESFAAVADTLAQSEGARIVLTGAHDEADVADEVARSMRAPALNLAGKTSLGGLAALIARLDLFISNDTGPAHIAHAVGAPSVTLFGPADPRRWAPLDGQRHSVVRHPVVCSPCGFRECPIDHRCMRLVTPAMTLEVARRHLRKGAIT